jgi:2-polyprenyl-6-methoxyphenol hydroxylase-like FAD-dependent oxidoreductase
MNDLDRTSVLIVGAGPTGLTLACDLARRGIALRIVEKAPEPSIAARAKGLQPRTLEVFHNLGVIDEVLAAGAEYPPLRAYLWRLALGWRMHKRHKPTAEIPYPNTWLVPQGRTEAILRNRLAQFAVQVEFATELTGLAEGSSGVTASLLQNNQPIQTRADFLVGADGGHSFVRKALGIGFEGETRESERMIVGDVRVRGLDRAHWHVWPKARGGACALCPLPGTESFQFTAQLPAGAPVPNFSPSGIQSFFHAATGSAAALYHPEGFSVYRPNIRMVDRYRQGRIFLAGDAAHVHPPTGGQGLNTGVQDAFNLGWKLALLLGGGSERILDTYEEERLPIAASVLGISTRLYTQTMRNGLRPQRRGAETTQLGLHYRGSSLSRDGGDSRSPLQAGDRAPDGICRVAGGPPVRLFDLFRGTHFTLLAFGMDYRPADSSLVQTCRICEAPRAYGIRHPALVLVRPDGYIALITRDAKKVCDYLASLF